MKAVLFFSIATILSAHATQPSQAPVGPAWVCSAICNLRGTKSEWHENGPIEAHGYAPREVFDRVVNLCDGNGEYYSYLSTPILEDEPIHIYRIHDEEKARAKSMAEYPVDDFCGPERTDAQ